MKMEVMRYTKYTVCFPHLHYLSHRRLCLSVPFASLILKTVELHRNRQLASMSFDFLKVCEYECLFCL